MKKAFYGALAAVAALGIAFSVQTMDAKADGTAAAAPAATPRVPSTSQLNATSCFSLDGDILTITKEGAKQILVSKGSFKKKTNVIAPSTWDTYYVDSNNKVKVDLSKYSKTADGYLLAKMDFETDAVAVKIKLPASKKITAKYDKMTGKINVTNPATTRGATPAPVEDTKVDVRIESAASTAKLSAFKTSDLAKYQMSGGAVYVSEEGTTGVTAGDDADAHYQDPYDILLPQRATKESKVTIAKLPNAPGLKVNYVSGKITVPKKAKYRIYDNTKTGVETDDAAVAYETAADKVDLLVADVAKDKPFAVDVYSPATTRIPDSRIAHNVFGARTTTTWTEGNIYLKVTYKKNKADITVANRDANNAYSIGWKTNAATPVAKTSVVGKATLKNDGTIKKEGSATLKNVLVTGTGTENCLTIRRNGDAKTLSWAGEDVKFINFTKAQELKDQASAVSKAAVSTVEFTPIP